MKNVISSVKKITLVVALLAFNTSVSHAVVLYDNGPLANSPGSGGGGADESVMQSITFGMNTLGLGNQVAETNTIADDFTIPPGPGWNIDTITFYGYQTDSTTTSTIVDVRVQIWDGPPAASGSNLLWGDLTINRLKSSSWSNTYRVAETSMGATNRPIMANETNIGTTLSPGTYWLAWQVDGTLDNGPWAPPISVLGLPDTGNGLQSIDNGVTYAPLIDGSPDSFPQGFPFIISGTVENAQPIPTENAQPIPTLNEWGVIMLSLFLLAFGLLTLRMKGNRFL